MPFRRGDDPAWWAEARRLREEDPAWTEAALAAHFGKSVSAVHRALNPERLEKYRTAERVRSLKPERRLKKAETRKEWGEQTGYRK